MNEQTQENFEEIQSLILDSLEHDGIDERVEKSFYRLDAMYQSTLRCDAALAMMRKRARWVIKSDDWDEKEVALLMDIVGDSLCQVVDHIRMAMTCLHDGTIEATKANDRASDDENDV